MKKLLSLAAVCLIAAITIPSGLALQGIQNRADTQHNQYRFIGAWHLVWLEEPGADGQIHRVDCTGLLVFTRDGHMSVQDMYRNPGAGERCCTGAICAGRL